MADLDQYRERMPVVGRMIDKSFNGDRDEDDTPVDFILITCKVDGNQRVMATLSNIMDPGTILGMMLKAFAEDGGRFRPIDEDEPVGHA